MSDRRLDCMFLMSNELCFALRSVKSMLEQDDIRTDRCDIAMRHLGELKYPGSLVVVEAELLLENQSSRVFLFDLCIEKNAKLVLIGWEDDIASVADLTSSGLIAATIQRPINAKQVVEKVKDLLEEIRNMGLRKNILIVDDSPTFLRTASGWLDADYNVSICPSATAAFHMIEMSRPDLILLDYEMPVCSGAQFLEMLHSENATRDIPVIFLTSRNDSETVKEVVSLKPQGYILKTQPKESILNSIKGFFLKA